MQKYDKAWYGHIITLITVIIWGTTFISTKILLADLAPEEILFYRFLIGYFVLFMLYFRLEKSKGWREELLFFTLGVLGVTLYFLLENIALTFTLASNVGLLSATVPILTAIVAHFFTRDEKLNRNLAFGFFVAISGTALVIFNGQVVLKLNPLGDLLALLAPLVWAFYSVLLKRVDKSRHPIYVTRKIFFYGLITIIPILFFLGSDMKPSHAISLSLIFNILFLGLLASALCFVFWSKAVEAIGIIRASNYIYLVPLVTLITSVIVLQEPISALALLGGVLILIGVYISERGFKGINLRSFASSFFVLKSRLLGVVFSENRTIEKQKSRT